MKHRKKILLTALGCLSLGLGTLGIVLPVLPTTPFYLLTAWCFMRSSPQRYNKVMHNKFFGAVVRNYVEKKAVPKRVKVLSICTTLLTIGLSITAVHALWLRLLLFCVALGVCIHLLRLKTF